MPARPGQIWKQEARMYTRLGEEELKTGERMEVGVVAGPDAAWRDRVAPFLGHKGSDWQAHIVRALEGPLDGLETLFYVGTLEGEIIAQVMIVGSAGAGILGHVFTRPDQRRKGAYQLLMAHQMRDVAARGYRVLTLGTGFDSPPYWIYHGFGFRSLVEGSGQMKWLAHPEAEAELYRPRPTRVRELRWGDWGALGLLAVQPLAPGEEWPRSVAMGCLGPGNLEGPFIGFQLRREREPRARAQALVTEEDLAVGWASVMPDNRWFGQTMALDAHVHPAFAGGLDALVDALDWPDADVVAYVRAGAPGKAAALRRHRFQPVATLPRWLTVAGERGDLELWRREV
jgi:Acetyltransferase (GNAT) domain